MYPSSLPQESVAVGFAFAVLISCVGSALNALTLVALVSQRKLRAHSTTDFVVSLTVSDLLYCAFCLPITADTFLRCGICYNYACK